MEQPKTNSLQPFEIETCARVGHEANRAFSATLGDHSHQSWETTGADKKRIARLMVTAIAESPGWTPQEQHNLWMNDKICDGWSFGYAKDEAAKLHPCIVPFDQLPPEQAIKDQLFITVVKAVMDALWRLPK